MILEVYNSDFRSVFFCEHMFCDISNEPGTVPSISAVKLLLALPVLFSKYQLSVHSKF